MSAPWYRILAFHNFKVHFYLSLGRRRFRTFVVAAVFILTPEYLRVRVVLLLLSPKSASSCALRLSLPRRPPARQTTEAHSYNISTVHILPRGREREASPRWFPTSPNCNKLSMHAALHGREYSPAQWNRHARTSGSIPILVAKRERGDDALASDAARREMVIARACRLLLLGGGVGYMQPQ